MDYPQYRLDMKAAMDALGKQIPGTRKGFGTLHTYAMSETVLSVKTKELIALGIAIADRCDACISFHVYEALHNGASPEEIAETIGVAVVMGGGPSMMYGAHAWTAVQQFLAGEIPPPQPRPVPPLEAFEAFQAPD